VEFSELYRLQFNDMEINFGILFLIRPFCVCLCCAALYSFRKTCNALCRLFTRQVLDAWKRKHLKKVSKCRFLKTILLLSKKNLIC